MVGGTPGRSGWWGVPWKGLDGGGYPGQVSMVGVPWPGLDGGGVPQVPAWSGLNGGGYPRYPPGQVWMVGGGVLRCRTMKVTDTEPYYIRAISRH